MNVFVADRHRRQRERRHLEVVDDGQPLETGARGQLAAEPILVARRSVGREERVEVRPGLQPRLAVPGERELRPAALRPRAGRPRRRRGCASSRRRCRSSPPRPISSPPSVVTSVDRGRALSARGRRRSRADIPRGRCRSVSGYLRLVVAVILHRVGVPPAPDERLAGPQHHVHGGAGGAVAVARRPRPRRRRWRPPTRRSARRSGLRMPWVWVRLIRSWSRTRSCSPATVWLSRSRYIECMSPSKRFQRPSKKACVTQWPTTRAGRHLQPRPLPEAGQADGVVAAGVVAVDVEDLDGIAQLVVVAAPVIAVADLLKPERDGLLAVRHARLDGRGHDLVEACGSRCGRWTARG